MELINIGHQTLCGHEKIEPEYSFLEPIIDMGNCKIKNI